MPARENCIALTCSLWDLCIHPPVIIIQMYVTLGYISIGMLMPYGSAGDVWTPWSACQTSKAGVWVVHILTIT